MYRDNVVFIKINSGCSPDKQLTWSSWYMGPEDEVVHRTEYPGNKKVERVPPKKWNRAIRQFIINNLCPD